jgi:hypothetical protein
MCAWAHRVFTIPALLVVGGSTHVAGRLTRAAYQPSFAYALPFHLPPVSTTDFPIPLCQGPLG